MKPDRAAFTLLELLIVLGVIVILLGLGLPSVQRSFVRGQLNGTAHELQSELYRARLNAMKTGKAYAFRYRYGGSVYEILPKEVLDQRERAETGWGAVAAGPELLAGEPATDLVPEPESRPLLNVYEKELPHRIVFYDATGRSIGAWSIPIVFYPNGRTSSASLVLQTTGRYAYRQELILRGLTGTARIVEKEH